MKTTRDPVHGKARITQDRSILTITVELASGKDKVTEYAVEFLESHPDCGAPAWRLSKLAGGEIVEKYDVILTEHGAECDCPDFTFCRQYQEKGCKHVAACRAVGLLR